MEFKLKTKSLKIAGFLCCFLLSIVSCKSTKVEDDPYFLADMERFVIGTIKGQTKQNFFKPKITEIDIYFYPRNSNVAAEFRDGVNSVLLVFEPDEIAGCKSGIDKYLELYENNSFDPNFKPGRKNYLHRGNTGIWWGVAGYTHNLETSYKIYYKYLDDNPYFNIDVPSTMINMEDHIASPTIDLYIAPNQLKELIKIYNMDNIKKEIEEYTNQVYSFE